MAERRIINGNVYERGPDGTITLVGPAQGAPQTVLPPNPIQVQKAQGDIAGQQANTTGQQIDNSIKSATAPDVIAKTGADADKAAIEAQAGQVRLGVGLEAAGGGNIRNEAINAFLSAKKLDELADELERRYQKGPGATSGIRGLADYLPTAANQKFNAAANRARGDIKKSLGFTGGEGNTMAESSATYDPYTPQTSDKDAVILDKIGALRELAEKARAQSVATLGGVPDANGQITPLPNPSMLGTGQAPALGNEVSHDAMVFNQQVNGLYLSGASADQIIDYFNRNQRPVSPEKADEIRAAVIQRQQGKPVQFVPPSDTEGKGGPSGMAVGALGAIDAGMGGYSDEMAALINSGFKGTDYGAELSIADAGKKGAFAQRPGAALAGAVAGGIMPGMAIEGMFTKGLSRLPALANAGIGRTAAEGALYGSVYGSGTDNSDRLGGAAWGAGAGTIGAGVGHGLARGAQVGLGGFADSAATRLAGRGINLTPGQLVGGSGIPGRILQRAEDASESIPLLGSVIRNAREQSFQDFNRAATNEAMAPIGERIATIGPAAVDDMTGAVGRGYDRALGGQSFTPDLPLANDLTAATALGRSSRQFGQDFDDHLTHEIAPIFSNPAQISGQEFQDVYRTLGGLERRYDHLATAGAAGIPAPTARVAAQGFEDMGGAFNGLVQRQAPDVLPQFNAANEAYRNSQVIRDAVDAGRNGTRSGQPGVYAPSQLADAAAKNARKFGGTQGTPRQPFYELSRDAQEVLPSDLGNSGTFDRAASAALLGAPIIGSGIAADQGWIDPKAALAIAAAAGIYSRPGLSALRSVAAAPRPPMFQQGSQAISPAVRRRFGLFGSAVGAPLLLGQQ